MSEMNSLFAAAGNPVTVGGRGLSGTAQLTEIASGLASNAIRTMNDNIEEYSDAIKTSQRDNTAMDNLIDSLCKLDEVNIDFLKVLDEETVDGMLKSQQSKRSRCKSKAMTLDNYKALMTAGIAENLIRLATGKEKNSVGRSRLSGSVDYTIEQLQELSDDQEKLRKEIRNIQSKKSIMKSKADFDENSERYQALLKAEQQLKDMRVGGSTIVEVDTTKNALTDLLNGVDIHGLKANDAKALLENIAQLAHNVDDDEAFTDTEETTNNE